MVASVNFKHNAERFGKVEVRDEVTCFGEDGFLKNESGIFFFQHPEDSYLAWSCSSLQGVFVTHHPASYLWFNHVLLILLLSVIESCFLDSGARSNFP